MSNPKIVKNYVVVDYVKRGPRGRRLIDAVPNTWIYVDKVDNKLKSYYPPKEEWGKVQSMVQELKEPDENSWQSYTVNCRYNTGMYFV